ncbi:hypothetical protein C8R43DRAFT_440768 [Mycena crocata]|nr:hypothetical protein C8R43DRAFT_440768 [Mycena crocata]
MVACSHAYPTTADHCNVMPMLLILYVLRTDCCLSQVASDRYGDHRDLRPQLAHNVDTTRDPGMLVQAAAHSLECLQSPNALDPNALAVFNSFPNEILGEIFLWTTPTVEDYLHEGCGSFHVRRSPWILGHICHHWRAVALSSPSLWTVLVFVKHRLAPFLMLETQLHRAGHRHLYISMTRPANLYTLKLLEILMIVSPHWRELDLNLSVDPKSDSLVLAAMRQLATVRRRLQSLHSLYLDVRIPARMVWGAFGVAPKLRKVTLAAIQPVPQLPTAQLTHISMYDRFQQVAPVLRSATSLVVLMIRGFDYETLYTDGIYLPQLQELHSDAAYLQCITAPRLEYFRAIRCGTTEHLPSLIVRSSCSIRGLLLIPNPATADILRAVLKTQDLTTLDIDLAGGWHRAAGAPDAINRLIHELNGKTSPIILPCLRTLRLNIFCYTSVEQDAIIDMIESRWHLPDQSSCQRLNSISLAFRDAWSGGALKRLSAFSAEGLEVLIAENRSFGVWGED